MPRRIDCLVMMPNQVSINRPWGLLSRGWARRVAVGESVELPCEAVNHAGMTGHFGVPTAGFGVLAERGDVRELGLQRRHELNAGGEVVALLAQAISSRSSRLLVNFQSPSIGTGSAALMIVPVSCRCPRCWISSDRWNGQLDGSVG